MHGARLVCAVCERSYQWCTWFSMWRTRSCWTRHWAIVFSSVLWSRFRCLDRLRIKRGIFQFENDKFPTREARMCNFRYWNKIQTYLKKCEYPSKTLSQPGQRHCLFIYRELDLCISVWTGLRRTREGLEGCKYTYWWTFITFMGFFSVILTCDGVSWEIVSCQQQLVRKSARCDRSLFFCSWLLGDCHLLKSEAKQCTPVNTLKIYIFFQLFFILYCFYM